MIGNFLTTELIGIRIAERRIALGFDTPKKLAIRLLSIGDGPFLPEELKKIERKRRNISNWENGNNLPSLNDFISLCNTLDCDLDYLLGTCQFPRKDTPSIMEATGLSEKAAESLIGIFRYGPTDSLTAINALLEHEDFWKFFGRLTEKAEDENPLYAIGTYLSGGNPTNGVTMPNGTRIHGENYNDIQIFIDRAHLDKVQDTLKSIKKAAPGDCQETAKHDP